MNMKIKMSMERRKRLLELHIYLHLAFLWGQLQLITSMASEQPKTYIISMNPSYKPSPFSTHESWHHSILNSLSSPSISSSSMGRSKKLIYSYNHAMHGFSARLTPSELMEIEISPAHRATFRERYGKVSTTNSPQFLGLNHTSGLWPAASYGQDVIIGIVDTGVWPESKSFSDKNYTPIPRHWTGECETGTSFNKSMCNLKLIGARSFSNGLKASARMNISTENDYDSPRDSQGHGTQIASIAAGSIVSNTSYFGYSMSISEGVAPFARLAIYKISWFDNVISSDVLAGIDKAIADGVDIISLSLDFGFDPYYDDMLAIGALRAVKKGIFVVCAAGNDGHMQSTHNGSPWITTVGASTTDRRLSAQLSLGKHGDLNLKGTSYYPHKSLHISNVPLFYGKNDGKKEKCLSSSLEPAQVQGKVILCNLMTNQLDIFDTINEVNRTRAKAAIFLLNIDENILHPTDYKVPIVVITNSIDANKVLTYVMKEKEVTVKELRFGLTDEGIKPAPQVALFSSRGPDPITPTILKPDILAPGKDILAAWIPIKPYITINGEILTTNYALGSGTSMATPHIAGVAALLKSVHRDWTPAAIRSAIMTTATYVDNMFMTITDERTNLPATPLDFGAGLVNPNAAANPGLIYDMEFKDYGEFLCSLGYTKLQMEDVTGESEWKCNSSSADLNYPSFIAIFTNVSKGSQMVKTFRRVVTNIGDDKVIYTAHMRHDPSLTIQVQPSTLNFTKRYERMGFTLTVGLNMRAWNSTSHHAPNGYLHWMDRPGNHIVSSPVVAIFV